MASKFLSVFFLALLTLGVVYGFFGTAKAETLAALYVDPAEITGLNVGDSFTINITVATVTNLAGWQFQLFYSTQVVIATAVAEGPFLKSVQNTIFVAPGGGFDNSYNTTTNTGRVYLACATLPATGVNGSGTLASVTFQTVGAGSSALALSRDPDVTKLLDNTLGAPQPIPHTTADGFVSLIANDIGITNISLSKTIVNDTEITINVTASNLGNFTASFSVILYYDSTEIGTQTITNLSPSTSLILTFIWDTTPIPIGNYTISAYAPPITGENNTENNRLIDGWIVETILGDLNGDGKVNILDISIVAKAFGLKPGDVGWNPNADLDDNGTINILDISKVAKEFGKTT